MSLGVPTPRFQTPDAILYEYTEADVEVDHTHRPASDETLRYCISERFAREPLGSSEPPRLDRLLALAREREQFCRGSKDMFGLARCLGNQALIQKALGHVQEAQFLLDQLEPLCRRIEDVEGLIFVLLHRAALLAGPLNQPTAALPVAEEAHRQAQHVQLKALEQQAHTLLEQIRGRLASG